MAYLSFSTEPHTVSEDELKGLNVIAFNISRSIRDYYARPDHGELTVAHILSFTQRTWRIDPERAGKLSVIVSYYINAAGRREIIGVFKHSRYDENGTPIDGFFPSPVISEQGRYFFLGEPAQEELWNKLIGNYLPEPKPGEANPVRYYEQD